jgi:predicted DNA-binding transcriptional regulator YafY
VKRNGKRGRPPKDYSQAARVLELYERLHRGDVVRAVSVAADLKVGRRTIERDLSLLHELRDLRLERVDEPTPGWRIAERKGRWTTTRWQVLAVALGARMSGFLSGRRFDVQVRPLLEQLRSSLPAGVWREMHGLERKLHVVEAGQKLYRDRPESQRVLEEMIDALLLDQPTSLVYHSPPHGAKPARRSQLRVHALCLTVHRGAAYFVVDVLGGDRHVGKQILLALDRMSNVTVDRKADARRMPDDFSATEFFNTAFGIRSGNEERMHTVRVRIRRELAYAVRERVWHRSQMISELSDGELLVEMELGDLQEVSEWVVGMGEHAKAEAPPELVQKVKERHRNALAQYAEKQPATYSDAGAGQASLRGQNTPHSRSRSHE